MRNRMRSVLTNITAILINNTCFSHFPKVLHCCSTSFFSFSFRWFFIPWLWMEFFGIYSVIDDALFTQYSCLNFYEWVLIETFSTYVWYTKQKMFHCNTYITRNRMTRLSPRTNHHAQWSDMNLQLGNSAAISETNSYTFIYPFFVSCIVDIYQR